MPDNRFPSPGVDARFPSPGVDVRFPSPGVDNEHTSGGLDTRFEGAVYGTGSDPAAEVQAILSGTTGWAVDPSIMSTVFQDTAGVTPVTADGQSIGRINSLTGYGTTVFDWQDASLRPAWRTTSVQFDGVDDVISRVTGVYAQAMPALSFTVRAVCNTLATNRAIFSFGTDVTPNTRYNLRVNTDGSVTAQGRRLNADGLVTVTSATGLITATVPFTLQTVFDYAGTGNMEIFLNGASVATGSLGGVAGNSENTDAARVRWGLNPTNTLTDYLDGKIGRAVFARSLLNSGQLASCKNWAEALTL